MSNILSELKYTKTHEWIREEDDGVLTIGITDHAQALLGDIVFVELPEPESELNGDDEAGVVESVEAALDIYCPLSGEVVAINETLLDTPGTVNTDPYGEGWLFQLQPDDIDELRDFLDAEQYAEQVAAEGH